MYMTVLKNPMNPHIAPKIYKGRKRKLQDALIEWYGAKTRKNCEDECWNCFPGYEVQFHRSRRDVQGYLDGLKTRFIGLDCPSLLTATEL